MSLVARALLHTAIRRFGVYPNATPATEPSRLFQKVATRLLAHALARVQVVNDTQRTPGKRVACRRVSSAGQNLARQLGPVGECDLTFTEKQSGKSATDRPQLQALIRHVRRGDHVVVASMDRLARSVIDRNDIVQQITGDPTDHTELRLW
jgi:hypothetical protein